MQNICFFCFFLFRFLREDSLIFLNISENIWIFFEIFYFLLEVYPYFFWKESWILLRIPSFRLASPPKDLIASFLLGNRQKKAIKMLPTISRKRVRYSGRRQICFIYFSLRIFFYKINEFSLFWCWLSSRRLISYGF